MKRREPGKCSRLEVAGPRVDTESVGTPVLLVIALLLPTAAAGALLGAGRVWRSWQDRRNRRAQVTEPIEALGATLRRLHAQLETLENQSPGPGKGLRVRAARAAYVDVLCAACRRLDVAAPASAAPLAEIYRVEADLRRRGLDLRDVRDAHPR